MSREARWTLTPSTLETYEMLSRPFIADCNAAMDVAKYVVLVPLSGGSWAYLSTSQSTNRLSEINVHMPFPIRVVVCEYAFIALEISRKVVSTILATFERNQESSILPHFPAISVNKPSKWMDLFYLTLPSFVYVCSPFTAAGVYLRNARRNLSTWYIELIVREGNVRVK